MKPAPAPPSPSAATPPLPSAARRSPLLNSDGTRKKLPPGPPSEPPFTLVLRYDDFGPQASADRLLGPAWWSWEAGGNYEIDDAFDVRVVIYQNRSREAVAARYPTVRAESDYRLVTRTEALRYLDERIAELDGWIAEAKKDPEEHDFRPLRRQLAATRDAIVAGLPAKG